MRKILTVLSKVFTNVFAILFSVILVAATILNENATAVNAFLGVQTWTTVEKEEGANENEDLEYYKSDFDSVRETKDNAEAYTQKVVGEGAVLLKNDNDALPLGSSERNVSLYSISSVNYVAAGTGSSGTNNDAPISLKEAMEDSGFVVNGELWNWYNSNKNSYGRGGAGGGIGVTFQIKEAPWNVLPAAKNNNADAAIFVLSRNGGEGADLTVRGGSTSDMTNGNYLELSPQEIGVLREIKLLKDEGVISKVVVLMNSANPVQCDFVDDPNYGIDAMLWIGDTGSTGIKAVAEILAGNINPSGRLSDTFWKKHYLNPVYANFGSYSFTGGNGGTKLNSYVVYQEGIYNGYRYTETRYEDYVLGQGNAGDFIYEDVVSYPFGYGLSYTQFSYSNVRITAPLRGARNYTVTLTVTNTGDVAGKEVVQVYIQKPYTDYDAQYGIEKAAVELVGFAKTDVIQPKGTEDVTIEVDERYFTSYDANGAGTYIIDEGDYYLTVAKDAHDAVNNILAAKGKNTTHGMTESGNAAMTEKFTKNFDATTYAKSDATGADIVNRFDDADLNRYTGAENNQVTYISRNDWVNTVKLGLGEKHASLNNQVVVTFTQQMREDGAKPIPEEDNIEYPTYGSEKTHYQLADLRVDDQGNPIPYDSPLWDDLLDQLTWEDTVYLLTCGLRTTRPIKSVGKPGTIDHNGATGPVQPYNDNAKDNRGLAIQTNDPNAGEYPTLYPCNGLVASTFNTELIEEMGVAMGNDCLWAGYNGIYGFGINMHRGAYGGRAFEYYSEDPILAGLISAAEVRGIQSKGTQVYMKHCFLNDQEKEREGICTWANEQTIREIYLKPFQIAIEEANAYNVMSGFNRLGVKWTGHHGFLNTVMRGEFGMKGIAVTDWYDSNKTYMSLPAGVLAGSDLPDGTDTDAFKGYETGHGAVAWAMRESAHRILYMHTQGNAMNGISSNMIIVVLTPAWTIQVRNAEIALGVLFGASVIFLATMLLLEKFYFKKK